MTEDTIWYDDEKPQSVYYANDRRDPECIDCQAGICLQRVEVYAESDVIVHSCQKELN